MFKTSDKVICVDDSHPNPNCQFPVGYVIRGCTYHVKGVTQMGGVQIEGLPVLRRVHPFQALQLGQSMESWWNEDVGWKPHRFRKFGEIHANEPANVSADDQAEEELVCV